MSSAVHRSTVFYGFSRSSSGDHADAHDGTTAEDDTAAEADSGTAAPYRRSTDCAAGDVYDHADVHDVSQLVIWEFCQSTLNTTCYFDDRHQGCDFIALKIA